MLEASIAAVLIAALCAAAWWDAHRKTIALEQSKVRAADEFSALEKRFEAHADKHERAIAVIARQLIEEVGQRDAHEPSVVARLKKLETSVTAPNMRGVPGWQQKG
jgi:hypothetical protein